MLTTSTLLERLIQHTAQAGNVAGTTSAIRSVDYRGARSLQAEMFHDPEMVKAIAPHCTPEELAEFIPDMSNESRLAVIEHCTRAPVMRALATTDDMSPEIQDFLLKKGPKVAMRYIVGGGTAYSPDYRIAAWTRMLVKFNELSAPPRMSFSDWTRERIDQVFTIMCENKDHVLKSQSKDRLTERCVQSIWHMAEMAGTATDEQRALWTDFAKIGPQRFYDDNGIDREVPTSDRAGRRKENVQFNATSDISYLLGGNTFTGDDIREIVEYFPAHRFITRSPHAAEFLDRCDQSALQVLVAYGSLPLSDALSRTADVRGLAERDSGDVHPRVLNQLTFDLVKMLAPKAALSSVEQDECPVTLDEVHDWIAEELSDNTTGWQFFWSELPVWDGSIEELVDTAAVL